MGTGKQEKRSWDTPSRPVTPTGARRKQQDKQQGGRERRIRHVWIAICFAIGFCIGLGLGFLIDPAMTLATVFFLSLCALFSYVCYSYITDDRPE